MEPTIKPVFVRSATEPVEPEAPPKLGKPGRIAGLDGIRGLAALFVVLHHCWLMAFPGFPSPVGPAWAAWLAYGHLAVVVFIVLSGFSLAVSPARSGWRLDGLGRFARRRAWRILPTYWAALASSLAIAWAVVPQPGEGVPTGKSVLVFGSLLQDIIGSPSPNGAFWSIAVEAHLYFVFPLLLLLLRRTGAIVMLCVLIVVVTTIGLLAPGVHTVHLLMRLSPQFAVLFGVGVVAAGVVRGASRRVITVLPLAALAATVPVILLIVIAGQKWTVTNLFWVDLVSGPAVGLLLAAVATGRPAAPVRLLDTRALRGLGTFSYSLYLIHAPIVVALSERAVAPHFRAGVPAFLATLALAVPISLLTARLFAAVFELPFQRYRSWSALRAAIRIRFAARA
jgi:peptidoglycan/LPS O-acetylase OafA/YrhL